jgi:MFS transporter, DHA1 family, multidrug resistance protein
VTEDDDGARERRPAVPGSPGVHGWMLVVLGALTAIPPLSFDMYLPALPRVADDLGVAESNVQLTLSVCLLGLAVGQLVGGPVSDTLGRRRVLFVGASGYVLFSAVCALAPSLSVLVLARFLQGSFGGAALATARAVVRDRSTGTEAARIFSLLMLVSGAAPIVAPIVGGLLIRAMSWRGVFVVLALLGVAGVIAVATTIPETLSPDARRRGGAGETFSAALRVTRDRTFLGYALTCGFGFGGLFFFISSSSFVFQHDYELTSLQFSLVFATSALGLMICSRLNAGLVRRFGPERLLRWGVGQLLAGAVALVVALRLGAGLPAVLPALIVSNTSISFVAPNSTALALAPYGREAGLVSAYLGLIQFAVAAIATTLAGLAGDTTAFSMAYGILTMGVLAAAVHALLVRGAPTDVSTDVPQVLEEPMSGFVEAPDD